MVPHALSEFQSDPTCTSPTRVIQYSQTLIDRLIVSNWISVSAVSILRIGLSDHYPKLYTLKRIRLKRKGHHCTIKYSSFKNFNKYEFMNDLSQFPWSIMDIFEDPDDALNYGSLI